MDAQLAITISATERETGISKDALRVWERRYGFPQPQRDSNDERVYPQAQVDKLRVVKRLLDAGYRPGKLLPQSVEALLDLDRVAPNSRHSIDARGMLPTVPPGQQRYLDLLLAHDAAQLRETFTRAVRRVGLRDFILNTVAPLTLQVGHEWVRGALAIHHEHLFTETLQAVLREAIQAALRTKSPKSAGDVSRQVPIPRVLLTTLPYESHGLGLLMVEAILALHRVPCVSLGTNTPVANVAIAAQAHGVDIVALSFSQAYPASAAVQGLNDLRRLLPAHTALWAGGSCAALHKRRYEDVTIFSSLLDIETALTEWHAALMTQAATQAATVLAA